jgi:hypothetical protein
MAPEPPQRSFLPTAFPDDHSVDDADDDVFFISVGEDDYHLPLREETENAPFLSPSKNDVLPPISSVDSTASAASMTRIPSKSILKASWVEEEIPICTKKKSWKTMPAPDLEKIRMRRVDSLNSFFDFDQVQEFKPPTSSMKRIDSKVEFQNITVREYDMTIGDNPSVSYGTPVSLDWGYEENAPLDLDIYEAQRGMRRKLKQMNMNYYQRRNMLIHKCGFTEEEVKAAGKQVQKTKNERAVTSSLARSIIPFGIIEDIGESIGRKAKRALKKLKKNDNNNSDLRSCNFDPATMNSVRSFASLWTI